MQHLTADFEQSVQVMLVEVVQGQVQALQHVASRSDISHPGLQNELLLRWHAPSYHIKHLRAVRMTAGTLCTVQTCSESDNHALAPLHLIMKGILHVSLPNTDEWSPVRRPMHL